MEEAERREGDKRRNYPHENEEVEKDREREMKERERESAVFRRALARGYDVPRAWLVSSTFPVELR